MQMKTKFDLISKKEEFQDKMIIAFWPSREYIEEQVEYEAVTYIKCLSDMEQELWAKGIDSKLPIIVKMRRLFSSFSAPMSSQVTIPQHSPTQSIETTAMVSRDVPDDPSWLSDELGFSSYFTFYGQGFVKPF